MELEQQIIKLKKAYRDLKNSGIFHNVEFYKTLKYTENMNNIF